MKLNKIFESVLKESRLREATIAGLCSEIISSIQTIKDDDEYVNQIKNYFMSENEETMPFFTDTLSPSDLKSNIVKQKHKDEDKIEVSDIDEDEIKMELLRRLHNVFETDIINRQHLCNDFNIPNKASAIRSFLDNRVDTALDIARKDYRNYTNTNTTIENEEQASLFTSDDTLQYRSNPNSSSVMSKEVARAVSM